MLQCGFELGVEFFGESITLHRLNGVALPFREFI